MISVEGPESHLASSTFVSHAQPSHFPPFPRPAPAPPRSYVPVLEDTVVMYNHLDGSTVVGDHFTVPHYCPVRTQLFTSVPHENPNVGSGHDVSDLVPGSHLTTKNGPFRHSGQEAAFFYFPRTPRAGLKITPWTLTCCVGTAVNRVPLNKTAPRNGDFFHRQYQEGWQVS